MDQEAHEREADRLGEVGDELETRSDELGGEAKDLREDWESKKGGSDAPGATDPGDAAPGGLGEEEEEDEPEEDDEDVDPAEGHEDAIAYESGDGDDAGDSDSDSDSE